MRPLPWNFPCAPNLPLEKREYERCGGCAFSPVIVDDNEAIHNDLKKVLLPREADAQLSDDEALLFGGAAYVVPFAID